MVKKTGKYDSIQSLKFKNYISDTKNIDLDNFYFLEIIWAFDNENDDDIVEWIAKNINGEWTSLVFGRYYFSLKEDAMAVKLRWT